MQQSLPETAGYRWEGKQPENCLQQQESFQKRRVGKEQFTLQFCWRGRERAICKGEKRNVLRRQQTTLYQVIMQDCSISLLQQTTTQFKTQRMDEERSVTLLILRREDLEASGVDAFVDCFRVQQCVQLSHFLQQTST